MKKKVLSLLLCFASVVVFCSSSVGVNAKTKEKEKDTCKTFATEVVTLVNEEREENGLEALSVSEALTKDASVRAKEIAKKFSHTRPNGEEWYTLDEDNMYGENLGKGYTTAQDVFDAWMKSKSHKENILWDDFTQIGVAVYISKDGKYFWVQEFSY